MDENREKYFRDLAEDFRETAVSEKLYTRIGLTLDDAADRMKVSRYDLSRAINKYLGGSFPTFINGLRMQEALRLLNDPENKTKPVDEIAHSAGFLDRKIFYRISKRITGKTPSEWKMTMSLRQV